MSALNLSPLAFGVASLAVHPRRLLVVTCLFVEASRPTRIASGSYELGGLL